MSFWHFYLQYRDFKNIRRNAGAVRAFVMLLASLGIIAPGVVKAESLYTVELKMKDGRFSPETLEVPAGQKIKIVLINEGPGAEEFESTELRKEKVLAPGAKSFVTIAPLKPGSYRFFGEFHPETAQGKIVAK